MMLPSSAPDPAIRAIAALDDELRRGMYTFIRRAPGPVTRDQAAAAVGISRKLAAFHLDKLVEAGVLVARYGTAGDVRRVGRAPKVYEPSATDIRISIPSRQHDLLADILLEATLDAGPTETARDAAFRVAGEHGRRIGAAERDRVRPGRLGAERALTLAAELLARHGFEPMRETATCVRLRDCPFHPLTGKSPELVCGINHAFLAGTLAGLNAATVDAVLTPHTGNCCVQLVSGDRR